MLPDKIYAVYFSGTGTTKKTVTRIARRLADGLGAAYEEYDYTLPDARQRALTIPAGALAVVGCPTYAGRVPNLLMPYLRDMVRGGGALALPVVLFGNRNYDDALMELSLRLVRRTLPPGLHRTNGRVAGLRRVHQVLCLRQGLSHRGEVF